MTHRKRERERRHRERKRGRERERQRDHWDEGLLQKLLPWKLEVCWQCISCLTFICSSFTPLCEWALPVGDLPFQLQVLMGRPFRHMRQRTWDPRPKFSPNLATKRQSVILEARNVGAAALHCDVPIRPPSQTHRASEETSVGKATKDRSTMGHSRDTGRGPGPRHSPELWQLEAWNVHHPSYHSGLSMPKQRRTPKSTCDPRGIGPVKHLADFSYCGC